MIIASSRMSREGKRCSHKQSCRQEKYRFEGIAGSTLLWYGYKMRTVILFLIYFPASKMRAWKPLTKPVPGPGALPQAPCAQDESGNYVCKSSIVALEAKPSLPGQFHLFSPIVVIILCWAPSALSLFYIKVLTFIAFLSNWENPLPQFWAAPGQNFLLLLLCSCSFPFIHW